MAEKVPNEVWTPKQCVSCGCLVEPMTHGEISDVHGFKLHCPHCDRFVGWGGLTKPVSKNGERTRSSNWTAKRLNQEHCQMCQRHKTELGKGERLEVHHIVSISQGGADDPANIWVLCTACHRQVHYQRTYHNEHQRHLLDTYHALQRFKRDNPELYSRVHGYIYGGDNDTA